MGKTITGTFVPFGFMAAGALAYITAYVVICAGALTALSFLSLEEAAQVPYYMAYWGFYAYTSLIGVLGLGWFFWSLWRLRKGDCAFAHSFSWVTVLAAGALFLGTVSIILHAIGTNPWASFVLSLFAALAGFVCVLATSKCPVMFGRGESEESWSKTLATCMGSSYFSSSKSSDYALVMTKPDPTSLFGFPTETVEVVSESAQGRTPGWPCDHNSVFIGVFAAWEAFMTSVFANLAVGPTLNQSSTPFVVGNTDVNGQPDGAFSDSIRTMAFISLPVMTFIVLAISFFGKNYGGALISVLATLALGLRYAELESWAVGCAVVSLITLVGIFMIRYIQKR